MLAPGTQIGRYLVSRKLAEGGMAEIYLATAEGPEGFSKDVVIKVVRSFLATDPQFVQMFIAEARLASRLNHANVVQIFDFGKHDDTYYLAMEYVRGASLWDLRQRCRQEGLPFPPTLAAELTGQIARGLQYAHSLSDKGQKLGVVHRDVTPHNVLLSFDGAVKLTDFGIAKATSSHTAPGMLKGKFAYMSPEQARGEPVDARTDIFALGIVLWELLTGGKLFDGDSELAVLRAVEASVIVPPARLNPDVSSDLSDIVMKALARPLPERFQTAFELEKALGTWVLRTAHSMEDTSVSLFLRQVYAAESQDEGRPLPMPAAGQPDDDFGHGDTRAVDRSKEHGGRDQPHKTMTLTPVRSTPRHATPGLLEPQPPRITEQMPAHQPEAEAEEEADSPRKGTEQMPAYQPGTVVRAPTAGEPEAVRPKAEHYRPPSRRLEPLVVVDPSADPSRVVPKASAPDAEDTDSASQTEPAGPEDLPTLPRSRGPVYALAAFALLGVLAGGGYLATRPSEVEQVMAADPPTAVAAVAPAPVVEPTPAVQEPPAVPPETVALAPGPEEAKPLPEQPHPAATAAAPKKKAQGSLSVRAYPFATVSWGKNRVEVMGNRVLRLDVGTWDVVITHPKKTMKRRLVIQAGATEKIDFNANEP